MYVCVYQLYGYHEHSLERELAIAQIEEVLEARAEQLDDERIVPRTRSEVEHLWHSLDYFTHTKKRVKIHQKCMLCCCCC